MTHRLWGGEAEAQASARVGQSAHAEGSATSATGMASHAEGLSTTASGAYAHAEGQSTTVNGTDGHAEGYSTNATGLHSHAGGYGATTDTVASWARGSAAKTNIGATRAQTTLNMVAALSSATNNWLLSFDGSQTVATSQPSTANVLVIPANSVYAFVLTIAIHRTASTNVDGGYIYSGMIARDGTGTPAVSGLTQVSTWTNGTSPGSLTFNIAGSGTGIAPYYLAIYGVPTAATNTLWLGTLQVTELVATS